MVGWVRTERNVVRSATDVEGVAVDSFDALCTLLARFLS